MESDPARPEPEGIALLEPAAFRLSNGSSLKRVLVAVSCI